MLSCKGYGEIECNEVSDDRYMTKLKVNGNEGICV